MYFFYFVILQSVSSLRIDIAKFTGKVLNDNSIVGDSKTDNHTKATVARAKYDYNDVIEGKNDSEINDIKKQITLTNAKLICCDKDYDGDSKDTDCNKNQRCISISHKYPLRFEGKIFARVPENEHDLDIAPYHEDLRDDKEMFAGEHSKLTANIVPLDDVTDKSQQFNAPNRESYNTQVNVDDEDSDNLKHRLITINHKFSPKIQNKVYYRNLEDSNGQVASGNNFGEDRFSLIGD